MNRTGQVETAKTKVAWWGNRERLTKTRLFLWLVVKSV